MMDEMETVSFNQRETTAWARDYLDQCVERKFSDFDHGDINRLKRLYHQACDAVDLRNWYREGMLDRQWFAPLMTHLSLVVLGQFWEYYERNRDERFVKSVVANLSLGLEDQMIAGLTLRDGLRALEETHPNSALCIDLKFFMGCKLREIEEITSLSTQQIRTHLNKGMTFLKEQL